MPEKNAKQNPKPRSSWYWEIRIETGLLTESQFEYIENLIKDELDLIRMNPDIADVDKGLAYELDTEE